MNKNLDFSRKEMKDFWELRERKDRKWMQWGFYGLIIAGVLTLIQNDLSQESFSSLIGCLFLAFICLIFLGLHEADILDDRIDVLSKDIYELKHSKGSDKIPEK